MIEKAEAIVTHNTVAGVAFAVRVDNGESIFIPRQTVEALKLEEFDDIEVILTPSTRGDCTTKWFAIKVAVLE